MIIVNVIGGLGNQLFQYCLGRSVSARTGIPFKLDVTGFSTYYRLHRLALPHFAVPLPAATRAEIARFKPRDTKLLRLMWLLQNLRPRSKQTYLREQKLYTLDPDVFAVRKAVYLDGYWQNEKYFQSIMGELRRDLVIKTPPDEQNRQFITEIQGKNAVSIHFRKCDYTSDPKTRSEYDTVTLDYYRAAVNLIASRVSNPHFYVFSDDPGWVKANFTCAWPMTCLSHNGSEKNYEDLRLMSLCRHHIIANSSFSWWGAWLNPNPDKLVVAPREWIHLPGADTADVTPPSWIRL